MMHEQGHFSIGQFGSLGIDLLQKSDAMGEWGNGNFEQDGALDFIWREVQQPLLKKIRSVIATPTLAEADEPDSGPIVAAVEILALLSEHVNAVPPMPDEIATWKTTFLEAWERTASEVYLRQADVDVRRAIIAGTFDRLAELSARFHT